VSLRDAGQAITGCKSNAHFLVWENVFLQVLSHQGESDCGSDVALPLHPAVIGNLQKKSSALMNEKYYEILGVTEKSSLEEIKKAFRLKAKQLHPDTNKEENAHSEFILLLEAYEYLVNFLTGKILPNKFVRKQSDVSSKRWQDDPIERAKRRAEYYANSSYTEFEESEYFKTVDSVLLTIASHLPILGAILLYGVLPFVLIISKGKVGIIVCFMIWFITLPFAGRVLRESEFKPKELFKAILIVFKTRLFKSIIFTIINLYVILFIGFQTLIPLSWLLVGYLLSILISFVILKFIRSKEKRFHLNSLFFSAPLIMSSFLLLNYYISFNPKQETYYFQYQLREHLGRYESTRKTTMIDLENKKYEEFKGIRVFLSLSKMRNGDAIKIRYTFKEGIFGIRVMTDYKFY
jgi:hypothetical protein